MTVTERADGTVRFSVRVQPRSSREGVDGLCGFALRVRVHAAPTDGAANESVIAVIAEALRLPIRDVRIVRGLASRDKVVEVQGVAVGSVAALAFS